MFGLLLALLVYCASPVEAPQVEVSAYRGSGRVHPVEPPVSNS